MRMWLNVAETAPLLSGSSWPVGTTTKRRYQMKLLKYALDKQHYDLAAHVLVYGLIKAKIEENGKKRRPKRQPKRP